MDQRPPLVLLVEGELEIPVLAAHDPAEGHSQRGSSGNLALAEPALELEEVEADERVLFGKVYDLAAARRRAWTTPAMANVAA